MLTHSQQQHVLALAQATLRCRLEHKPLPSVHTDDPMLSQITGVFVTLKIHGQLRGCIGNIIGQHPLVEGVQRMALAAAFEDPRFPPVTKEEYPLLEFEISVLTPPQRISNVNDIVVGRHGLIIKQGFFQGVLLPQVPTELGWTRDEFLIGICRKAGLPPSGWKNAELFTFEAEVFP
jgi:AmmeMemoRadiSam system protein A